MRNEKTIKFLGKFSPKITRVQLLHTTFKQQVTLNENETNNKRTTGDVFSNETNKIGSFRKTKECVHSHLVGVVIQRQFCSSTLWWRKENSYSENFGWKTKLKKFCFRCLRNKTSLMPYPMQIAMLYYCKRLMQLSRFFFVKIFKNTLIVFAGLGGFVCARRHAFCLSVSLVSRRNLWQLWRPVCV